MWQVEVRERGDLLFCLRLPAAGLRLGGTDACEVLLPGARGAIKLEPSRHEVWATLDDGRTETMRADEPFAWERWTLLAKHGEQAADAAPRGSTKWLRFDAAEQTLTAAEAALRIAAGPDAPREIEIDGDTVAIGKDSGCDVVLTDPFVSGCHARLQRGPDGWTVADLGSRNGVYLNDARVMNAVVPVGAKLRLGKTELWLTSRDNGTAITPHEGEAFHGMVGRSPAMRRLFGLIARIAPTDCTALIQGPTGSGKELVARAIHAASPRASGPFVAVNCGAVVRGLVASELFGHVRGAFTGAAGDRAGLFELAHGGTVFLDEIGELPLDLQPNLLRVLEDREVRRVGGSRAAPVNVRVIAATNRDLRVEAAAGRFREDLFYRLDMIPLVLPPLRDRPDDLPLLAAHLLEREAKRFNRPAPRLSAETLAALEAYDWPGNVRELANVLARAMLLAGDREAIEPGDLQLRPGGADAALAGPLTLDEAECEAIKRALALCPNRKEAARRLGIVQSTLYAKMRRYGLA